MQYMSIYVYMHIYTCAHMCVYGFPGGSDGKEPVCKAGDRVQPIRWENPLEKGMVTHSSILAWKIPWTKEPGEL